MARRRTTTRRKGGVGSRATRYRYYPTARSERQAKKEQDKMIEVMFKAMYWLFFGWWIVLLKFLFLDLPSAITKHSKKKNRSQQATSRASVNRVDDIARYDSQLNMQQNKKRLLAWQQLVTGNSSDELFVNEEQLKSVSVSTIENDLRIIDDSRKIIQSTVNPDTFFSRLELFEEKHLNLQRFEPYMKFANPTPTTILNVLAEQKQDMIHKFLIRYYEAVVKKAETLKTERGRKNQYQKFYDSLQKYYHLMDNNNIQFIENRYLLEI